jgi:hypothetical protein
MDFASISINIGEQEMAAINQTGDLPIKRMGTALRNMGLASLLVFVIPAIGFWYFYLAGQMAIAARDAAKAYNLDQFQKVKRITTANLIVSATFFLIAASIWLVDVLWFASASGGGSGSAISMQYYQTMIWGCGSFVVAWGITSACLNIGLWNAFSGYFKTGSWVSPQDLGPRGCKVGLVGSSVSLIAWVTGIPVMILASLFVNVVYSPPYVEPDVNLILLLLVLLAIALLHGFASICTQVPGFFKTGSAFRELDATDMASRTSPLATIQESGPSQQSAAPRVLYDTAAYIPDPVPVRGDAMEQQSQQGVDAVGDVVSAPVPAQVVQPSSSSEVPAQTSQAPTDKVHPEPLEHREPSITKPKPQFCPHCGNPLMVEPGTSKCEYCGEKVFLG